MLYYSTGSDDTPRVVVPHDEDLKYRILYEAHDVPVWSSGLAEISRGRYSARLDRGRVE
ncbi:hypothetical protein PF005_g14992 [Phytophthora fragariae]|uniref:Uncharacterized protein n=1 Tax=Phytophthora fragariae TaxID=53985 RepID=A0A6A3RVR1_9STRA|nr:hypothetical protein PF003_g15327 [Phytophthora fragariae]KAE8981496.1 hypothetical protein PF011_g21989 [Phytophthora fragariae]KAE9104072.1 hypothetical protein PF006_g22005 [Phytophthora fragariae]KAE9113569.1 hypothetical protein PF007_g10696 [Phytophthora fragariae]KAE9201357.1 hypothetical protein PF005_g14992 [Phytophthora fragariae]